MFSCGENQTPETEVTSSDSAEFQTPDEPFKILISSFRGNEQRNYYGENPPTALNLKWKIYLGKGRSSSYRKGGHDFWQGAGWTGQPLLTREDDSLYIYQGSLDYNLKKLSASDGRLIWQYKFDDVIKGTGTIFNVESVNDLKWKHIIVQGSRRGYGISAGANFAYSLRAISAITGDELWRYNVRRTQSFSRDADGSPLFLNDTLYAGLENGIFAVINPVKVKDTNKVFEPEVIKEFELFGRTRGRANIVIEASPVLLGNRIYISSGAGLVYGFNTVTKDIDWEFYIGSDLDGTPAVTHDSCILVPVEKQYIPGNGGLLKLDPSKPPEESVVWYLPTANKNFLDWQGGIIGSPAVNTLYEKVSGRNLAAVMGIDGFLYLIDTDSILPDQKVRSFDARTMYPTPLVYDKYKVGTSISSPLIIDDILIAGSYNGLHLFRITPELKLELLDVFNTTIEATPIVYEGRIYIGSKDGNLYCFGN